MRAQRRTSTQERRIRFLQVLLSVTRHSIMVGVDIRFRKLWGDDTIFKGSASRWAPLFIMAMRRFSDTRLNEDNSGPNFLYRVTRHRPRTSSLSINRGPPIISRYLFEDLVRIGKFHMVGSFRLDHEDVEVDSSAAPWLVPVPPTGPASISADHWVPLWGFGMGNDFGQSQRNLFQRFVRLATNAVLRYRRNLPHDCIR